MTQDDARTVWVVFSHDHDPCVGEDEAYQMWAVFSSEEAAVAWINARTPNEWMTWYADPFPLDAPSRGP